MTTLALAPRIASPVALGETTSSQLRLTRRGRIVVTLLLLGLMLVAGTAIASRVAATSEVGGSVSTTEVTVGAGDTLWGIAGEYAEPGHTKEMIREIKELNALSSSTLQVGQVLAIPLD